MKIPLQSSLLEKLTNDTSYHGEIIETNGLISDAVKDNLQKLLNTYKIAINKSDELDGELINSLVNYGISPLDDINPDQQEDRLKIANEIKEQIRLFEPRLREVEVELHKNTDPFDLTIRFSIFAKIIAEPMDIPVQFDSQMDPLQQQFTIKDVLYE